MPHDIPLEYLHLIADMCPNSLATYLLIVQLQDDDGRAILNTRTLADAYVMRRSTLIHLYHLARAGLLECITLDDGTIIATLAQ